jgi:GNAT superfamily N-acetyltransferase
MSANLIINFLSPLVHQYNLRNQVEEIFFESSTRKEFIDNKERDEFLWKYLGFYLTHYPEYAWVFLSGSKVLGYIIGMPFTHDPTLFSLQSHLKNFESLFIDFPAHLHINCHVDSRGKGVGRCLVEQLLGQLKVENISGVHIMTGHSSENRYFYEKLGFSFSHSSGDVLFMGKRIE